ncbi:MAG: zinc-ribbon domain-containing protein, partial [Candidatus Micrarchaeota archaeon]
MVNKQYCKNCGFSLKSNSTFCSKCGTKRSSPEQETAGDEGSSKFLQFMYMLLVVAVIVFIGLIYSSWSNQIKTSSLDLVNTEPTTIVTTEPAVPTEFARTVPTVTEFCGDGTCSALETCSSCQTDCGSCIPLFFPTFNPQLLPPANTPNYFVTSTELVSAAIEVSKYSIQQQLCSPFITPTENVRAITNRIVTNIGSGSFDYLGDSIAIYKWIQQNIRYELGSYSSNPNKPETTLYVKGGKCDEQSYLLASMV